MGLKNVRIDSGEPVAFVDEEARAAIENIESTIGDINTILESVV